MVEPARLASKRQGGSALVIVLSALVLICILVVAFISQATLSRKISFTSAGQSRADTIAQTGLDTIIGDLRTEIAAGSTATTNNGIVIYEPTTNFTVVPNLSGADGFTNVVKRSVGGSSAWSGPNYLAGVPSPRRASAGNSTTNLSSNGRYIDMKRWNAPYLLGATLPANFVPPDWVLITRKGPLFDISATPSIAALADNSISNTNHVIGRFAYMIYDEGGLIDVNVAGYPSGMSVDFIARRSTLPQVDLGKIPGVLDADAFVRWRNRGTSASGGLYADRVHNQTNGFVSVADGDQALISRQDLIKYVSDNGSQITTEALQYLGSFTRELNAPSFVPPASRAKVKAGFPQVGKDDEINPSLPNVRVKKAFIRNSGVPASIGEPLLAGRFPLSRLSLITRDATASDGESIHKYFGLKRPAASGPWIYDHGNSSRILTLQEVVNLSIPREPDFFELLQAAIGIGSLGRDFGGASPDAARNALVKDRDLNTFFQVIQIGANLIDQSQTGFYPTQISFGGRLFCGIKNLPYLSRVFLTFYRPDEPNRPNVGLWYQPELWNPHLDATSLPPFRIRFKAEGQAAAYLLPVAGDTTQVPPKPAIGANHSPVTNFTASRGIPLSIQSVAQFSQPSIPSPAVVDSSDMAAEDQVNDGTNNFVGVRVAKWNAPGFPYDPIAPKYEQIGEDPMGVNFLLQYWDDYAGDWITYSAIENLNYPMLNQGATGLDKVQPLLFYLNPDPRSSRFGGSFLYSEISAPFTSNATIRPDVSAGLSTISYIVSPGWHRSNGPFVELGLLPENKAGASTYYEDPDGVVRPGSGAYADGVPNNGGYPIASVSSAGRPMILNRAFRSVADMGYASRGVPWKEIDFFSDKSADAALLDVFCVRETPADRLEAGKVNLNTRQQPVLAAILSGAIKSELDAATSVISPADSEALASALQDLTAGPDGPLMNKSELVTRWSPSLNYATAKDRILKRQREAAVRAITDVGNIRTWNLLIDVIAQSGKYPVAAQNLQQFVVEGECRYWLHVAIDRYTGKVEAKYLERVAQ